MNPTTTQTSAATRIAHVPPPTHEQIAALAFSLHRQHGGQHGHDREDWLEAEQMLLRPQNAEHPGPSTPKEHWTPMLSTPMVEHSHARDERHSPSRGEIRQMNTSHRPAARESQRARD